MVKEVQSQVNSGRVLSAASVIGISFQNNKMQIDTTCCRFDVTAVSLVQLLSQYVFVWVLAHMFLASCNQPEST